MSPETRRTIEILGEAIKALLEPELKAARTTHALERGRLQVACAAQLPAMRMLGSRSDESGTGAYIAALVLWAFGYRAAPE